MKDILPDTFYDTVIIPLKNTEKFWWFSLKNESKGVHSEDVFSIFYMCQHFPAWNMEIFIFNTGNSTATFSCTKFGKYHASCRDICAHNFLYETWKILIEVINIFRKINLHILILRQGCQKHTENGHKKSYLCRI